LKKKNHQLKNKNPLLGRCMPARGLGATEYSG